MSTLRTSSEQVQTVTMHESRPCRSVACFARASVTCTRKSGQTCLVRACISAVSASSLFTVSITVSISFSTAYWCSLEATSSARWSRKMTAPSAYSLNSVWYTCDKSACAFNVWSCRQVKPITGRESVRTRWTTTSMTATSPPLTHKERTGSTKARGDNRCHPSFVSVNALRVPLTCIAIAAVPELSGRSFRGDACLQPTTNNLSPTCPPHTHKRKRNLTGKISGHSSLGRCGQRCHPNSPLASICGQGAVKNPWQRPPAIGQF